MPATKALIRLAGGRTVLNGQIVPNVNVTVNVWVPAFSSVSAPVVYTNVPGTPAVAFSCAAPSVVPYTMFSGVGQAIAGLLPRAAVDLLRDAVRFRRQQVPLLAALLAQLARAEGQELLLAKER